MGTDLSRRAAVYSGTYKEGLQGRSRGDVEKNREGTEG